MRYVYDRATDSLAISFADGRRYRDSEEIHDGVVIDYDTAGRPIGIEFSDRASRYVDTQGLAEGRWIEIVHADLLASSGRLTGAELRARRLQLGMTQEQLADQLETTGNTIARWERDEVRIEHGAMLRLALDALRPPPAPGTAGVSIKGAVKALKARARNVIKPKVKLAGVRRVSESVVRRDSKTGHKVTGQSPAQRRTAKKR